MATDKLSIEDAAQVVTAFLTISSLQSLNGGPRPVNAELSLVDIGRHQAVTLLAAGSVN